MELIVERLGDVAVVVLPVTELDASNSADFKRDVTPLLDTNMKLVLDLSRLLFADSSGLGAFISCLRRVNSRGSDLKLCGMSEPIRALFELVGMHRVFDIYPTREAAARAFLPNPA